MLKRMAVAVVAALGLIFGTSVWGDANTDAVKQAEQKWAKLFNAKDLKGLGMTYTEDGMRLPPDTTRHQGRAAIEEHFKKELEGGLNNIKLDITDGGSSGNLVWIVGNYAVDYPGEGGKIATATGNYVNVYRKEPDGVWRTVVETWNDTPAK